MRDRRRRDVLGLGGVIGGEETGVTEATTNVFIESAYFDPKRTARTGRQARHLNPTRASDSSAASIPTSWCRGSSLPRGWCSSFAAASRARSTIAGKPPKPNSAVQVRSRPGRALERARPRAPARSSACSTRSASRSTARASSVKAAPPSWRPDITGPADLVEEVVRLVGVDKVPATPMPREAGVAKPGADRGAEAAAAERGACSPRAGWSRR